MSDILSRLDAAIADLCPCGTEPRFDSAYCSDDCVPTHRSIHSTDETAMRWRPDLVTAQDDTDLEIVHTGPRGPYTGTLYRRITAGPLHLRLDDGHRYVGLDVPDDEKWLADNGYEPLWERLERELGNTRHLEADPDDPWGDAFTDVYRHVSRSERAAASENIVAVGHSSENFGEPVTWLLSSQLTVPPGATIHGRTLIARALEFGADPTGQTDSTAAVQAAINSAVGSRLPRQWERIQPATAWSSPYSDPLADIRAFIEIRSAEHFSELFFGTQYQIDSYLESWPRPTADPEQPSHPMLAAIEARRNRNTGPTEQRRAPRQLRPGRRR